MTDTFTWRATTATSGSGEFKTHDSKFGDGYSQSTPVGISNEKQTWSVTIMGYRHEVKPALDFIRAKKGAESFFWTPPLGVQGKYRCKKYAPTPMGGNFFSLTMDFEEA